MHNNLFLKSILLFLMSSNLYLCHFTYNLKLFQNCLLLNNHFNSYLEIGHRISIKCKSTMFSISLEYNKKQFMWILLQKICFSVSSSFTRH